MAADGAGRRRPSSPRACERRSRRSRRAARGARARSRRPLLAALLALLVGGGVLAAPGVGSGLLERLGLRDAKVTKVAAAAADVARRAGWTLGERTTLAGARRDAGFDAPAPGRARRARARSTSTTAP